MLGGGKWTTWTTWTAWTDVMSRGGLLRCERICRQNGGGEQKAASIAARGGLARIGADGYDLWKRRETEMDEVDGMDEVDADQAGNCLRKVRGSESSSVMECLTSV